MDNDSNHWAAAEFGSALLRDRRRTARLVRVAATAGEQPAGKITEVFREAAEREAAFRFMENGDVDADAIGEAAYRACAARAAEFDYVFVPTDGTSLNLADWQRRKRLGVVGARYVGARGLHVMSAIAVAPNGIPLGLCGQTFWARTQRSKGRRKHDRRPVEQKETRHWLAVMKQTRDVMLQTAPQTKPWFQLDRGGDAWPVVLEGLEPDQLFTVRAAYNRRLWDDEPEGPRRYLWQEVTSGPKLGEYTLEVPGGADRTARTAHMEVRATEVMLRLENECTTTAYPAVLFAVLAREVSSVPDDEDPLEWLLLTSFAVRTLQDAKVVLYGYAQRWRIEEFHRIWKTGRCNIEETQLGDREPIIRWARILASVAVRLLRITYLGRHHATLSADVEFTREEIDAAILLRQPEGYRRGQMPTLGRIVEWIAQLGGYTGKSSGGPPGAIVLGRGLERIQPVVAVLKSGGKM